MRVRYAATVVAAAARARLLENFGVQCRHCDACRQPLEVDGEVDAGQRLVEIIDVEKNELLRGVEGAEVHEMAVAAGLHGDPALGSCLRSCAMTAAAPRRKVNGLTSIRR